MSKKCNDTTLTKIGHAYMAFIDQAGQANDLSFEQDVPKLFALECKKIVNGETKFETNEAFGEYLTNAQKVFGKWRIDQDYTLYPSQSTQTITLTFTPRTPKMQLLVIAILKVDNTGLITEIFEVDKLR